MATDNPPEIERGVSMSSTVVMTRPLPLSFVVAEPPASAGTLVPYETQALRTAQLNARIQGLRHELLPAGSEYRASNAAVRHSVNGWLAAAFGSYFTLLGGMVAAIDPSRDITGLAMGALGLGVAAASGGTYVLAKRRHTSKLTDKATSSARSVAELEGAFGKLSGLGRDLMALRARGLLRDLGERGAVSPKFSEALGPMVRHADAMAPDDLARAQALAELLDDTITPNGEISVYAMSSTEVVMRRVEGLDADARGLLAELTRGALQVAVDRGDGNRWRLRRLLETVEGSPKPYATETGSEADAPATTALVPAAAATPVTFERCVAILAGGLAGERDSTAHPRARTNLIPSEQPELAERVAAHFESLGYRAAIFEASRRLIVTVYTAEDPPGRDFVQGQPDS